MADIIKLARELGAALQQDERYKALSAAKEKNDADAELQKLIGDLNSLVENFNKEMEKGDDEKDQAKMDQMNKQYMEMYGQIMANGNMMEYQKAQQELESVANEVNGILAMSLNGEDPMSCDPSAQDCTHDCGSCGGCN